HERVSAFFAAAGNRTSKAVQANLGRLIRRYAADGTTTGYRAAHTLLKSLAPDDWGAVFDDLDRGLAERAVGLPAVGQGGLFDSLAAPGAAEPAKPPRPFDPLTPELADFIRTAWLDAPTHPTRTRLALRAGLAAARDRVYADLADPRTPRPLLLDRLAALEELGDSTCLSVVLPLLGSADAEVQT